MVYIFFFKGYGNHGLLPSFLTRRSSARTVTDNAGHTATATQLVTVTDNINPTITAPLAATGTTNADCTSTNVVRSAHVTAEHQSLTHLSNHAPPAFQLGNTTVT